MSRLLPLLLLLPACALCQPTPPPPGPCTGDATCPRGEACIVGSCQSLTQILKNLSAVVWPSTPGLAPQEYYQSVDGTQPSITLDLAAPQLWSGTFPLPPSCEPPGNPLEALPVSFQFAGHPLIPLLDWNFEFTTDVAGRFDFVLPADERFDVTIAPAVACAAPYTGGTDLSLSGPASVPPLPGSPPGTPADVLTVSGAITGPDGTPLAATVAIDGAQGRWTGLPLSATATTSPALAGGFVLPVQLAPVLAPPDGDGGACAPPPLESCDGGVCPPVTSCARFTLEVGPSPESPALPTFDIPVVARIEPAPDGGPVPGGPTVSLWGVDGQGLRLPIGPADLVPVAGVVLQPNQQPLPQAQLSIACRGPDGGTGCPGGYAFSATAISQDGTFSLLAPPGPGYVVTATPPPGLGLAPVSAPVAVGDGGVSDLTLPVPSGFSLTGTVLDPTGENPVGAGEVDAVSLADGALVGSTSIQPDGTFGLTLPPGDYLVVLQPADATGLPGRSEPVRVQGDVSLGHLLLIAGRRLPGGVFAEALDGGVPAPVPGANVTFYSVQSSPTFGTVALPVASGVTDAQGHFSVAAWAPPSTD